MPKLPSCPTYLTILWTSFATNIPQECHLAVLFCIGMCRNRISVCFRFLKTGIEPKPKGQTRNFCFRGFSQKRTCLIQIVNILAILTKLLHSSRYGHCRAVNDHEIKLSVEYTVNTVQYWLSN